MLARFISPPDHDWPWEPLFDPMNLTKHIGDLKS